MIHLAILLLLFSPLLIVVGVVLTPPRGRAFLAIYFILFLLGTAALLIAMVNSRGTVQPGSVPVVPSASLRV